MKRFYRRLFILGTAFVFIPAFAFAQAEPKAYTKSVDQPDFYIGGGVSLETFLYLAYFAQVSAQVGANNISGDFGVRGDFLYYLGGSGTGVEVDVNAVFSPKPVVNAISRYYGGGLRLAYFAADEGSAALFGAGGFYGWEYMFNEQFGFFAESQLDYLFPIVLLAGVNVGFRVHF